MLTAWKLVVVIAVLAVGLASIGVQPAYADSFQVTGSFGTAFFVGPLNGGSFSGTFSVNGFPFSSGQVVTIPTFDIFLFNSSDTLLAEIQSGAPGAVGNVDTRFDATAGDLINFNFGPSTTFLELQFPAGFVGTGPVIPYSSRLDGFGSFAGIGSNSFGTDSAIASGQVSSVPEPGTLLLLSTGFALVGLRRRK
jgi:hypothetical protein